MRAELSKSPAIRSHDAPEQPLWIVRAHLLLAHRRLLAYSAIAALIVSLVTAFAIPKQYTATARIMPPDSNGGSGALMLAALAGHSSTLGSLGSLAGGLLGAHSTTALFTDLLRSGTVTGEIIDRFNLQHIYRKRYRVDTAKRLARRTKISDDKKSGVITVSFEDTDPIRARDVVQAYLDGLNRIVTRTNTSSAHQERVFIERRLQSVQVDLEKAERRLAEFSSQNSTVDIKEQTHAMVDAAARVQGELLVEQAGLQSLRQIYGDSNVRVRATEARIASLNHDLERLAGSSDSLPGDAGEVHSSSGDSSATDSASLYPPLRQLPHLAVPYADLYRDMRVQETAYELLTQQFELSRLEEAKDVPVVSVIDPPGIPEKKSFPPRLLLSLALTVMVMLTESTFLILLDEWQRLDSADPRKILALAAAEAVHRKRVTAVASMLEETI